MVSLLFMLMRVAFETKVIDGMGMHPKGKKSLDLSQANALGQRHLLRHVLKIPSLWHGCSKGGCKAVDFNDWLAEQLCPRLTLKHVVILDNARLHKTPRTRELIEGCGASLMFLPPYSPDYNPIEHDFANIKQYREYHPQTTLHDSIQMYH